MAQHDSSLMTTMLAALRLTPDERQIRVKQLRDTAYKIQEQFEAIKTELDMHEAIAISQGQQLNPDQPAGALAGGPGNGNGGLVAGNLTVMPAIGRPGEVQPRKRGRPSKAEQEAAAAAQQHASQQQQQQQQAPPEPVQPVTDQSTGPDGRLLRQPVAPVVAPPAPVQPKQPVQVPVAAPQLVAQPVAPVVAAPEPAQALPAQAAALAPTLAPAPVPSNPALNFPVPAPLPIAGPAPGAPATAPTPITPLRQPDNMAYVPNLPGMSLPAPAPTPMAAPAPLIAMPAPAPGGIQAGMIQPPPYRPA